MNIQQHTHGAISVVRPIGAITLQDADQLRNLLTELRSKSLGRLVLDVSGVPFVDSRGLEVMLEVTEEMAHSGQALKLCGPNETLREVMDLTELAQAFDIYENVNTAVRSFM